MFEQKINSAQVQCNMLANQVLTVGFELESVSHLNEDIDQLANILDGRIIIVDSDFQIVKDTYSLETGKYLITEEVLQLMNGKSVEKVVHGASSVELFLPIQGEEGVVGAIVVTLSVKDLTEIATQARSQNRLLFYLFIFLVVVVAVLLAYYISKDFRKIRTNIEHVANGVAIDTLDVKGYAEIEDLAETFNEVIEKTQILENSRQEFVSNVSHELKTPITSMKILADSLVSNPDTPLELYQEFMKDIIDEIDRENKIINDLLSLVKMDKKASEMNIEMVSINDLLEILLKRLRPLAEKKKVELVFESFRVIAAEIDEVKLSLAISNIVENAIKYNVEGGWVHVSLNSDHKYFYVSVADSGIGIPEESQKQVFERFYRVDKSRNQETGGTGLGLAITRNAILMHNGAIKMHSEEGKGTTFTIRIPLTHTV
ncbi:MAG: sensor histidine kinase [Lachnospiraceae bacterium]